MGVRLNKVLTELQIGLQQAVDFLKQKKEYGEIRDDANVNTKITDIQYEILKKEFSQSKYKNKNFQQTWIIPKKEPKTIRCARIDENGKECGCINAYENTYCVKCGRVLEGKKKVEVIEAESRKSLEQRNKNLVDNNERLQKQNKRNERQIQDLKRDYEKTIRYLTEENKRLLAIIERGEKKSNS